MVCRCSHESLHTRSLRTFSAIAGQKRAVVRRVHFWPQQLSIDNTPECGTGKSCGGGSPKWRTRGPTKRGYAAREDKGVQVPQSPQGLHTYVSRITYTGYMWVLYIPFLIRIAVGHHFSTQTRLLDTVTELEYAADCAVHSHRSAHKKSNKGQSGVSPGPGAPALRE